jgi:Ni2+-binding GTPase involved in maturation of urease and hydrogenase
MVGGFLGAGKTTTLARLARHYTQEGKRVCLVTNDQAFDLVDTQSLQAQGFPVGEVTGACFCCKFNDLVETVQRLAAENRPDLILAEPVGSCTDLVATVVEPLARLYGERFEVGPLAVLLKPEHGMKILKNEADAGFSPKAAYIFLKQLEEADLIVLNKVDKLSASEQRILTSLLEERFPGKRVLSASAKTGAGFAELVSTLDGASGKRTTPEVDYDVYAEGEAELGWFNCHVRLRSVGSGSHPGFSLDGLLLDFVERMRSALAADGAEPAHLKVLGTAGGETAVANLVASSSEVDLSRASGASCSEAELVVNARVAIDPAELTDRIDAELNNLARSYSSHVEITNVQSFRPGRPVPTHRMRLVESR